MTVTGSYSRENYLQKKTLLNRLRLLGFQTMQPITFTVSLQLVSNTSPLTFGTSPRRHFSSFWPELSDTHPPDAPEATKWNLNFWTLGTPLISRILLCLKVREWEIFDQPEYDRLVKDKQVPLAFCRLTRKKNQREPDKATGGVYQTQNLFASIGGLAV